MVDRDRNPACIIKQLPSRQSNRQNSQYRMGFRAVEALCDCNGTTSSSRQTVECYISAKDLLPSCKPILKATAKGRCGVRRMIISTFILLLILVAIYCLSASCDRLRTFSRSLRNQAQSEHQSNPQPQLSSLPIEITGEEPNVEEAPPVEGDT